MHRITTLYGLAPGGVYIARIVADAAGALLPHLSILTVGLGTAVYFCCTVPGVASAGCYPAPCPLVLGLSSYHMQLALQQYATALLTHLKT